jgi:hypothetical protein
MRTVIILLAAALGAWACCDCKENVCGTGDDTLRFAPPAKDSRAPTPDASGGEVQSPEPDAARPQPDAIPDVPLADVDEVVPESPDAFSPDQVPADQKTGDLLPDGLDASQAEETVDASDAGGQGPDVRVANAPDYLNMRGGPGQGFDVLRAIPCGGEVNVEGEEDNGWLPVVFDGTTGWASASHLVAPEAFDPASCPGPAAWTGDVPGTLVTALDVKPYVEQSCTPTTFEGWPFEAQKCTYNGGLKVTVANPSPELVARWITDASQMIPALWAQKDKDPTQWKKGLKVFSSFVLGQSSRIFPLSGEVDEGIVYDFHQGVTMGCSTGCYCRINSLRRQEWCEYADKVLGIEDESDCLGLYSTTTWTDAWADHCLDNHRAAWTMLTNHHFRAYAWWANKSIKQQFPNPDQADGAAVVAKLNSLFSY